MRTPNPGRWLNRRWIWKRRAARRMIRASARSSRRRRRRRRGRGFGSPAAIVITIVFIAISVLTSSNSDAAVVEVDDRPSVEQFADDVHGEVRGESVE